MHSTNSPRPAFPEARKTSDNQDVAILEIEESPSFCPSKGLCGILAVCLASVFFLSLTVFLTTEEPEVNCNSEMHLFFDDLNPFQDSCGKRDPGLSVSITTLPARFLAGTYPWQVVERELPNFLGQQS